MSARAKGMVGQKIGRLTVLSRAAKVRDPHAHWLCACDCGGSATVSGVKLRLQATKSCGCLTRERGRATFTKHGLCEATPEYSCWTGMRSRCRNKRNKDYCNYGARGITVCERWDDFALFLADMGSRPTAHHSIERRDNDGNYEPSNCYWATPTQQNANRRNTVSVVSHGRAISVKQFAQEAGVSIGYAYRLSRAKPLGERHG